MQHSPVRLAAPVGRARLADALEQPAGDVTIEGDTLVLPYLPHQVLTVLVD